MKKIIAAIAAFTMAFALCSCGRSADSETAAAQPSEVTTAATTAETAAVTTVPQSTTTTTAESETTTPENTTTTAEVTTTSDSTTTTAAEKQTTTAEKKTTTAKQTTAAPKNTTAAKQTAVPKQTTAASKQTSAPKQTTARQTTTAKKTTTPKQTAAPKRTTTAPKQTTAPKRTTTAPKQTASPKETVVDMSKIDDQMWIFLEEYPIAYNAMYKQGKLYRNLSDYDKAVAVTNFAYETGGKSCIYYALNTYFLAQGAGLECYLVRSSDLDWYGHVANVAKIDGEYYYLEPQGNIVGAPHTFESHKELYANSLDKITDIYDNIISVTVADHWYNEEDGDGLIW